MAKKWPYMYSRTGTAQYVLAAILSRFCGDTQLGPVLYYSMDADPSVVCRFPLPTSAAGGGGRSLLVPVGRPAVGHSLRARSHLASRLPAPRRTAPLLRAHQRGGVRNASRLTLRRAVGPSIPWRDGVWQPATPSLTLSRSHPPRQGCHSSARSWRRRAVLHSPGACRPRCRRSSSSSSSSRMAVTATGRQRQRPSSLAGSCRWASHYLAAGTTSPAPARRG
jgi:hypothetical protein